MSPEISVKIEYSTKFLRSLKKLPFHIQNKAQEKEFIFQDNPFDPRMHTHKLHGKDREHWAYSIDNNYCIKFAFLDDDDILYLDVGTHEEVY